MRKVPTQAERVIDYIVRFGSITRADALIDLGIANLPAVIDDLRHKKGYHILTKEIKTKNRYEQNITYARYYLVESEEEVSGN